MIKNKANKRNYHWLWWVVSAGFLAAALYFAALSLGWFAPTGVEKLPSGKVIVHEDPATEQQEATMDAKETEHTLRVPSVGIDTELGSMNMYQEDGQNIINPPRSDIPFYLNSYAHPGDHSSMMVIAVHSIRGYPELPGSKLIDIEDHKATVKEGDVIFVDNDKYVITRVSAQEKRSVATDSSIWTDSPGKLLVFTCLQRTAGKSLENIVIEAQLEGS